MQVLADTELKKLMNRRELVIDPFPEMEQLQPASVDLRLGAVHRQLDRLGIVDLQAVEQDGEDSVLQEVNFDGELLLNPRDPVVQETFETVRIPRNHWGRVVQRSRYGRALGSASNISFKGDPYQLLKHHETPEHIRYAFNPFVRTRLRKRERTCQLVVLDREGFLLTGENAVKRGHLKSSHNTEVCGECGSILLHADEVYTPRWGVTFDPAAGINLADYEKVEERELPPRRVYLATTRERFQFSEKLAGHVERKPCPDVAHYTPFVSACFEAGFVDPGYEGPLTLHLYSELFPIDTDVPVATLTLYPVKGKVERPYGLFSLGSSHQDRFEQ